MTDSGEIYRIEKRLKQCTTRMLEMTTAVGSAKQVREYDSDRRKNLLARYVLPYLKAGHSATAAEGYARAEAAFETALEALSEQRGAAETTIASWEAVHAEHDALRSLLSMQKESLKTLEG